MSKLGLNAADATKQICYAKREGPVDQCQVNRLFKKFRLGCKKFDDQARSGRCKIADSDAVLKAVESIPVCISFIHSKWYYFEALNVRSYLHF